jgi:hypothetical protein
VNAPGITLALQLEDAAAAFDPGARVAGVAGWSAPARLAPRGMELRLIWTLQGKWERDLRIAATIPLPDPQASERRPFFLTLPLAPYSFRGTLLALEWTLQLVALPGEEKNSVGLIVAPGRRSIDLVHRELRK